MQQNYYNHANGGDFSGHEDSDPQFYPASLMRANPQLPQACLFIGDQMVRVPPVTLARTLMLPAQVKTNNMVLVEEAEYSSLLAAVNKP